MLRLLMVAFVLSLSPAIAAEAAAAEERPWVPKAQGTRIGLEFDWWPSRGWSTTANAHSLTWALTGQIKFARLGYIGIEIPWAVLHKIGGNRRETIPEWGNPVFGLHWADTRNRKIGLFAGGTITVSTLLFSDGVSDGVDSDSNRDTNELRHVRRAAVTSRAYADAQRFAPFRFFLRGRAGIEVCILPELYYRFDVTPILAGPITGAPEHTELIVEIHNEIEARASFGLGGGVHLQAVFLSAGEQTDINRYEGDPVQTAVEPYLVFEPIRGFYARTGVLIALDPGVGFGSETDRVVTLRAALGAKW